MSDEFLMCNRLCGTIWKIDDEFIWIRFPHGGELSWPIASLGLHLLDGENGFFLSTLLGTINGVAILSLLATKCSAGTLHFYHRTEQHIEKYGLLKPRVVELWMATRTENMPELGYCQQQGIYLAARKHGQLYAFYEAKEKASKVKIPHF
mgnify:CR=1 FL=1